MPATEVCEEWSQDALCKLKPPRDKDKIASKSLSKSLKLLDDSRTEDQKFIILGRNAWQICKCLDIFKHHIIIVM